MTAKIVVFTGDMSYSVRKGIVDIDRAVPQLRWLIVVHAPAKPIVHLARSQWRNLRRNGWRWIPHQAADLWHRVRGARSGSDTTDTPGAEYRRATIERRDNVRVLTVRDLHDTGTIAEVTAFAPDLGLSLAAPILRRKLFSIPRLGTLNLHKGKLPDYRGMPPAFWEFWNGESSFGCSIHWVDDKLDTGHVVATEAIDREPFSTVRGAQLRLDELGVRLMCDAVKAALAGDARGIPQSAGGRTYRKPTLAQVAELRRRLHSLQPSTASPAKSAAKHLLATSVIGAWRAGLRLAVPPRVTVLLYHRVSDSVRDNLTVGIEQFERHMSMLDRWCEVVSLERLLSWDKVPRTRRPLVCVTFDDGYLDNCTHAAPILARHGIPAAFFVSTAIITNNGRFPHDVRRGNSHIPLMTWSDLRAMKASGFTIGSHSANHIDCAAEPEDVVRTELAESRDTLRRELGVEDVIFAYPYGGRRHMTPQRLELVKAAGYVACLSAYGGTNIGKVDRFDVRRRGISWQYSDTAVLLECLGLPVSTDFRAMLGRDKP